MCLDIERDLMEAAMFKQGLSVGVTRPCQNITTITTLLYSTPAPKTTALGKKSKGLAARRSGGFYWKARKPRLPVHCLLAFSTGKAAKAGHLVAGRPTASNAYLWLWVWCGWSALPPPLSRGRIMLCDLASLLFFSPADSASAK